MFSVVYSHCFYRLTPYINPLPVADYLEIFESRKAAQLYAYHLQKLLFEKYNWENLEPGVKQNHEATCVAEDIEKNVVVCDFQDKLSLYSWLSRSFPETYSCEPILHIKSKI